MPKWPNTDCLYSCPHPLSQALLHASFKGEETSADDSKALVLDVGGCPPKEPSLQVTKVTPVRVTTHTWSIDSGVSPNMLGVKPGR